MDYFKTYRAGNGNHTLLDWQNDRTHCVSYILGKEFGVDVNGYAFEAPADFLRTDDPQTIRAELTDIRDTAYDISARMMRSLEQSKAPRQSEQER